MPQIYQLPAAGALTTEELVVISQNQIASTTSIADLLASLPNVPTPVNISAQIITPAGTSLNLTAAQVAAGDGTTLGTNSAGKLSVSGATGSPGSAGGVVITDASNHISSQTVLPTGASSAASLADIAQLAEYLSIVVSGNASDYMRINVSGTALEARTAAEVLSDIGGLGNTTVSSLPTSLPATAGVLWNNGGMISVS